MPDLSKLSTEELLAMRKQAQASESNLSQVSTEDLLKMRKEAAGAPKKLKPSVGESALRGAAQGAFMGFPDEITAFAGAVKDTVLNDSPVTFGQAYDTYIGRIRKADAEAEKENPKAFRGSQVGGAVASALLPGVGALNSSRAATTTGRAVVKGAEKVIPGLGAAAARKLGTESVGKAVIGGAQGAVTGAGMSESNPFKSMEGLEDFAGDTAKGGLIGFVSQLGVDKVGGAVANKLRGIPDALKGSAERWAFKAVGGTQEKAFREAGKRKEEIGRELLDNDIVTFGSKARTMAERGEALKKATGEKFDKVFKTIDDDVGPSVDGAKIAARIRQKANQMGGQGNASVVKRMHEIADKYEADALRFDPFSKSRTGGMTLAKAQTEKSSFRFKATDSDTILSNQDASNAIKMAIGEEMENAVERYGALAAQDSRVAAQNAAMTGTGEAAVVSVPGKSGVVTKEAFAVDPTATREAYEALKGTYGAAKTAQKAGTVLADRQDKNRFFSLTDYLAGAAGLGGGMVTDNPEYAVFAALANKTMRQRGPSAVAVTLDRASKALQSGGAALGKYAGPLLEASRKGNAALGVTHAALLNDPEYAKTIENLEKGGAMQRRLQGGTK